ncbi:MAG: glycosyltransferase family 4 protein, partial [Chloroflexota bacterium]
PGIFYHPSMRRWLRMLLYPVGNLRLLRSIDVNSPAIVHMQWTRLPRLDQWLIAQLHQRGIPVVYTAHDVEPLFSQAFNLSSIYTAVDAIIVHAEANRDFMLQRYPSLSEKVIRVIPHLASEWVIPPGADRASARAILSIAPDAQVLLFFGSSRRYKGLNILVEAFAQAREACPSLWLAVAGHLENLQIFSSLPEARLLVEPNYIPSDQVWIYHLAADLVVLPYSQISQSGELITAMSFGLPVIATNIGGMPETINKNGWVVPPNDANALTAAIIDAFSDIPRLRSMGDQSLQLIQERHSPAQVAQQTIALYEEIIRCRSVSSTVPIV